jgi:hypothetical protein
VGGAFAGILTVANGGTGTATPGLVAGTNITLSGSWPNQTINSPSPITTLGDLIYGGAAGAPTRLPGAVTLNGVPQYVVSQATAGVATAPFLAPVGVPEAAHATGYTFLLTDRGSRLLANSGSAVAWTLPQAGSTGFASNFVFTAANAGAGTLTITATTSTFSCVPSAACSGSALTLTTGQWAFIYSDNTNYFANVYAPTSGGTVTSIATTSPIGGGTITTTGTLTCTTCVVASSPGAGLAHFAGSTQTATSSAVVGADMTNNTVTATQLAAQYSKWEACSSRGIGDGLNAIPAGTYLQFACVNDTGVTVTITGIHCWTDNAGTSTLNAANNAATALLTGAVTCNSTKASGGAAGTQSATTTLANGDALSFTFVADGTSKQANWTVSGTY